MLQTEQSLRCVPGLLQGGIAYTDMPPYMVMLDKFEHTLKQIMILRHAQGHCSILHMCDIASEVSNTKIPLILCC